MTGAHLAKHDWAFFVRLFGDITANLFLHARSNIGSTNQFEITTTVVSEHSTFVSAAAPSNLRSCRASFSTHFLVTSSLHRFSHIKGHLLVLKVSCGPPLWRPHSTIKRPHDATYPRKTPQDPPGGTQGAPKMHPTAPRRSLWTPVSPHRSPR